ncbi:MAG: tetratricopeptide repeat protein [Desulfobulbaceae bacterium]|nr:tetratricopeptide repeat protein [Desulfobulbaceae bacterium]
MKKNKCIVCLKGKARRGCLLKEQEKICSRCCAEMRGESCEGCTYYTKAEQYTADKNKKAGYRNFEMKRDSDVDAAVYDALATHEGGDEAKAERIIESLLAKHPDIFSVHYGKGVVEAIKGNYKESITHFNNGLEIFPYHVESWFNKALSYQQMYDLVNTILSYRKVVEYGQQGDHFVKHAEKLLRDVEQSAVEDTGLSLDEYLETMTEYNTAFALLKNQEYEKAIIGFENVVFANKNHPQSYGNMGLCYAALGKKEKALELLDKTLELDPKYEPAISNRATVSRLEEGQKLTDLNPLV